MRLLRFCPHTLGITQSGVTESGRERIVFKSVLEAIEKIKWKFVFYVDKMLYFQCVVEY